MKYVVAVVASGAVLLFWAVISALVGFRHGGGYLGMAIMWMMVVAVWTAVLGFFPDKKVRALGGRIASSLSPATTHPKTVPPDPDREKTFYAKAMEEIEANSVDKGTWAQALAQSMGKEDETKARYITLRVVELRKSTPPPLPRIVQASQPMKPRAEPPPLP